MSGRRLAGVPKGASAEEVAAIVAALAVIDAEEQQLAAAVGAEEDGGRLDAWVRSARLSGRGVGLTRGPWRLAGRINRRHRA